MRFALPKYKKKSSIKEIKIHAYMLVHLILFMAKGTKFTKLI